MKPFLAGLVLAAAVVAIFAHNLDRLVVPF